MIDSVLRRRLVGLLLPVFLLGVLCLAACGLGGPQSHVPTAAEILQRATNVLNVNNPTSAQGANSATVQDLTYTLKLTVNMDMSDSSLGAQKLSETITATGEETLKPRRSQADMTMALADASLPQNFNLTDTIIVDYASQTGYIKMSGGMLPGAASGKWYKMSFASVGGLGADTSMYVDYSKLKDAKLIGSETINGVAVWHLRAKEDLSQAVPGSTLTGSGSSTGASNSVSGTATLDYYFRQDNYRPVKIGMAGNETMSGLGTATTTGEMDFTAFNTGVSIALPPANEVSPLQI
ncbi:MAG TPA: hypothetical protein VJQ45_02075 [Ktedonobacterales bacterium]|nr:hypothetical protein [Ktedonobacterales bacterium]